MSPKKVAHDALECPECGAELNASKAVTGKRQAPGPSDLTVCVECASVLRYGEGLELVVATEAEIKGTAPEVQRQARALQAQIRSGVKPLVAMAKPGRNEPCPCGSGTKFKRCCGDPTRLKTWIFDHPSLGDLWDTEAVSEEQATANFEAAWQQRELSGTLPENAGPFSLGKVRDEDEED